MQHISTGWPPQQGPRASRHHSEALSQTAPCRVKSHRTSSRSTLSGRARVGPPRWTSRLAADDDAGRDPAPDSHAHAGVLGPVTAGSSARRAHARGGPAAPSPTSRPNFPPRPRRRSHTRPWAAFAADRDEIWHADGASGFTVLRVDPRRFTATLRLPRGGVLRSATATLRGRRLAARHTGRSVSVTVDLRGVRRLSARLVIRATLRDGRVVRTIRTYHPCRARA